ncbi:MAG: hypothetical protein ACM31H_05555 [Nitrososphaerales archaeon]
MMLDLGLRPLKRFELIPKDKFEVSFADLTNSLLFINNINLPQIFSDAPLLTSLVKSVELPIVTIKDDPVNIGSTVISNISSIDIDELTILFYIDSKNIAEKMYYEWIGKMFDLKTNTKNPRLIYERNIFVDVYDRFGNSPIRKYTFYNCSPRNPGQKIRLDYEEEGYLEAIPITFNVNNGVKIILE